MRFIGSETESEKIISTYSGKRERKTWQTMSQKTTRYSLPQNNGNLTLLFLGGNYPFFLLDNMY